MQLFLLKIYKNVSAFFGMCEDIAAEHQNIKNGLLELGKTTKKKGCFFAY